MVSGLSNRIPRDRILHLTDVDDLILAHYEQINLRAKEALLGICRTRPRMGLGKDSRNAERALDLGNMLKAHTLEGLTTPGVSGWRVGLMLPEVLVGDSPFDELVVEEGEVVDELVERVALLAPKLGIAPDKPAALKLSEHTGEVAGVRQTGGTRNLLALHASLVLPKRRDDTQIILRIPKDGCIQIFELVFQNGRLREEHRVDILCQALRPIKLRPVVRDTAHDHVSLYDLMPVHADTHCLGHGLALGESERLQVNLGGQTVVEATYAPTPTHSKRTPEQP